MACGLSSAYKAAPIKEDKRGPDVHESPGPLKGQERRLWNGRGRASKRERERERERERDRETVQEKTGDLLWA
jgi:hypothetical protein